MHRRTKSPKSEGQGKGWEVFLMDSASLKATLFLVSDNQAVGTNFTINSPESLYTGLSFCLDTKGRVGNVSRSRGIYGSLLTLLFLGLLCLLRFELTFHFFSIGHILHQPRKCLLNHCANLWAILHLLS